MILATNAAALPSELKASLAINITTLLTVICWLFLVAFLISRFSSSLKTKFDEIVVPKTRILMWLIPTTAMAFSLYFSEVLNWMPCKLCWAQRAFIYPLALFMMLNLLKPNKLIRIIAALMCVVGSLVSLYHMVLEKFPNIEATKCNPLAPCSVPWFESIGFIKIGDYSQGLLTIAGMAFTAFITVLVLLFISKEKKEIKNG